MAPNGPYCGDCPHRDLGVRFIEPDGSGTSGILLVGDSPWTDEIAAGRNFSGAAGRVLDRQLDLVQIARRDVMVANTIWCKPTRLNWMDHPERYKDANAAIEHCRPNLDDHIERTRPKVIVPMGNVALRRICGVSNIESQAGYVLPTPYGVPAIPTYHPSFVMRGKQKLNAAVLFHLDRARSIADGTFQATHYELHLDPPAAVVRDYLHSLGGRIPVLVVDIETPESATIDEEEIEERGASWQIIRAGFSVKQGTAVSFPWQEPYIEILQEAINLADLFVEHADSNFDSKRLRHNGITINCPVASTLWAWHFLESDLRKGLGMIAPFFYAGPPWKHMSQSRPAFYNATDVAVTADVWYGVVGTLQKQGRWNAFVRHCINMVEPLQVMGTRGLLVDPVRQAAFMQRLESEWDLLNERLQSEVPEHLKRKKFWKRAPKSMEGVVELSLTDDQRTGI
jgi:uracil-DNA glycosylase family 4